MVSTLLLGIVCVLLLAYTAWKDLEHRRQIERMALLLKAKDVPEFVQSQTTADEPEAKKEETDLTFPENADPSELVDAIAKQ